MGRTDDENRAVNLAWWQEASVLHEDSDFYDLAGFRRGRDPMRPFEVDELGDVTGRDLLHLQCHLGTDTLAWARRGARVVGLDFSSNAVEVATRLAHDCGLDAEFVCADVFDAPGALGGRRFDVVYTGIGALNWLPDLAGWARVAEGVLRPGGVLYVAEIHPLLFGLADDGRSVVRDMVGAEYEELEHPGGTYAVPGAHLDTAATYERNYAISEVFTAVHDAGLAVELFHEHSYTNAPWPWAVRGEDGFFKASPWMAELSVDLHPDGPQGERLGAAASKGLMQQSAPRRRSSGRSVSTHLRRICRRFPEATEKPFGGHTAPAFRVRDKLFLMVSEDGRSLTAKAPPGVQQVLVSSDPGRFFVPPYVGAKGWVGMRLGPDTDWAEVAEVAEDSYRLIAPKRLVAQLDAGEART